jgi:hypothetical protein
MALNVTFRRQLGVGFSSATAHPVPPQTIVVAVK